MKKILAVLTSLFVLAASPGWARSVGAIHMAEDAIIRHQLLTPQQLACSNLVLGPKAIREAAQIVVLERHGGPCPGDPRQPPRVLFNVFVDPVSGAVQWNYPDETVFEDLPAPGVAPTVPSVLTRCGVCAHL